MPVYKHHSFTTEELQALSPRDLNKILIMKGFSQAGPPEVQFFIPMMSNLRPDTTMSIENGVVTFFMQKMRE